VQDWLFQIGAVELVQRWAIAGRIRRIDPRGRMNASMVQCVARRVVGQLARLWLVIRLQQTAARIDAGVIEFAALGRRKLQLGRTAVMALLDDFERHGARHDGKIQANRKQQGTDPASAERGPAACKFLNHPAFLDL